MAAAAPTTRTGSIWLGDATGRVAAEHVTAVQDVPAFDRSAMDGYAVRAADTTGASAASPRTLQCVERVFTGQVPAKALGPGECTEIATGAMMPAGADAVMIVEDTSKDDERVSLRAAVVPGQNLGRRGQDMKAGDTIVRDGDWLTPARVGAIASSGAERVLVYARPAVAIISTGNEIAPAGHPLAPGQVYDVNRFTLEAVIRHHGGDAWMLPVAADTLEDVLSAVDRARGHDLYVFSGGSSVGDRDLVIDAIKARGDVEFHGIAVKPGKPTALGHMHGSPVLALPGNPTSCLSNAYLFLLPMLRRMARLPAWRPQQVSTTLAKNVKSERGRVQFYMVRIEDDKAVPVFKSSGDITSLAAADGYFVIPVGVEGVEAGTAVTVTLF